ncbi:hypothetical protein ACHQM5_014160 [Ranunculus cassubicifolius]
MNTLDKIVHPTKWSSPLCACHGCATCCMTCCLPCVTFGRNAHMLDDGKTSCFAHGVTYGLLMMISCQCLLSCVYREKLRAKYGLPADPCPDLCVHLCCHTCALSQEHVELKSRGLDPAKGWNHAPLPMTISDKLPLFAPEEA